MELEQGRMPVVPGTLFIDGTAAGVKPRPELPIFHGDSTVLQMLQLPQPCFSAALTAHVEAPYSDDGEKNRLWATVPFHRMLDEYRGAMAASPWNPFRWGQGKALRPWIRDSRLDGFGKPIAGIDPQDAEKRAIAARLKQQAQAAMANMGRPMGGPA